MKSNQTKRRKMLMKFWWADMQIKNMIVSNHIYYISRNILISPLSVSAGRLILKSSVISVIRGFKNCYYCYNYHNNAFPPLNPNNKWDFEGILISRYIYIMNVKYLISMCAIIYYYMRKYYYLSCSLAPFYYYVRWVKYSHFQK